ncbi:hypothetical protein KUH03_02305 [Sphingobacterium sp. E70]|uniref:hypothetical protein n=1 Tax=Sphingobacterium sp. E70 TaxID=2853439 RepID=UPI00211C9DE7|nr:hypothetical protein [Sphingobacterium sp. E70]ULT25842.1 hypothetical protein KUH03_02305 [Sphingobacterium sp. E70]
MKKKDMKRFKLIPDFQNRQKLSVCFKIVLILCSLSTATAQQKVDYVLPKAAFNSTEAYTMLDEGSNTITGTISFKKGDMSTIQAISPKFYYIL